MRFRLVFPALALVLFGGCSQVAQMDTTLKNTGGYFGSGKVKALSVTVSYSPNPVRVGRSAAMDVTVAIVNNAKVQQSFGTETQQRINVQVRDLATGAVVATAQEGRSEDPHDTTPLLNPGESLSFGRRVSTANLRPGQTYQIEAFVVGSATTMHGQVQFVPQ